MRLWARITVTVAINLIVIGVLLSLLLMQQTRSSPESFLFAPARERVRELGRQLEEEFPDLPAAERSAWLLARQTPWGVTMAVFEDTGQLVAGAPLGLPPAVEREVRRGRRRGGDTPERPRAKRRARDNPPIFTAHEQGHWIGYHFPLVVSPGQPPVRHTLIITTPSLFASPFLFDWKPWLLTVSLSLLVTILCWMPVTSRLRRSLRALQTASAEIAEGRFEVPIPIGGQDEFADLAASLRRMAAQLSQLVNGQRRFLADIAHELCAPLSRIQLSMGILQQSAPAAGKTSLERLEREVAHMSALVGDLLSFTKGTVRQPELVALSLLDLVEQAVKQENTHQARISTEIAADLKVTADSDYLARALGNVIRNAIQYAGDAGPIRIAAQRSGDGKVELTVQDDGPGLPEADLEAIFHPFYRPDGARTPGTGGAGLGLAIVRSCMDACHGTVACRNRPGRGLEVILRLDAA